MEDYMMNERIDRIPYDTPIPIKTDMGKKQAVSGETSSGVKLLGYTAGHEQR
jgi:hypothetical protein